MGALTPGSGLEGQAQKVRIGQLAIAVEQLQEPLARKGKGRIDQRHVEVEMGAAEIGGDPQAGAASEAERQNHHHAPILVPDDADARLDAGACRRVPAPRGGHIEALIGTDGGPVLQGTPA